MADMIQTQYPGMTMERGDQNKLKAMLAADPKMCVQYILTDENGEKHIISECQGTDFCARKMKRWQGVLTWRKHYHTRREALERLEGERRVRRRRTVAAVANATKSAE